MSSELTPLTISNFDIVQSMHWGAHADRFVPSLNRMKFHFGDSDCGLKDHLLAVTDSRQLSDLVATVRKDIQTRGVEEVRAASEEDRQHVASAQRLFEGYFDGIVKHLVAALNEDLPPHQHLDFSAGRGVG